MRQERPSDIYFLPQPHPSGLVGLGGELSSSTLIWAYAHGLFPWYSEGEPVQWFNPDPRFVLFLDEFRIPKSLKPMLNVDRFEVTRNKAFTEVLEQCKTIFRPGQGGTWITNAMQKAYLELWELGYVLSVEVWEGKKLVGGLYGVKFEGRFSGESMFSLIPNASKLAFVHLVRLLNDEGLTMIDCQVHSDHLARFGAREISREAFLQRWIGG